MPQQVGTINLEAHALIDWSYEFPATLDDNGNLITSAWAARMQVRDSFKVLQAEAFVAIGNDGKPLAIISRDALLKSSQYFYDLILESPSGVQSKRYSGTLQILDTITDWSLASVSPNPTPNNNLFHSYALPTLPAAQSLSALRLVSISSSNYTYSDPADLISVGSIAGLTLQSVNAGSNIKPIVNQLVSDQSWNWVRGSPVFLGAAGTLTQIPPSSGNLVAVARVLDSKILFICIEETIRL